jgi:Tol biopolymer transport system component
MVRPLLLAILVSTVAIAAPAAADVGPKIAYSTQTEVYLINPDGSGKVRLHRSRSNDFISSVSLRPGGGQIAFVENWAVKFIDFDVAGRPVGPIRTIGPSCYRLYNVRYHPDGNSVLFHELCGDKSEIKQSAVPSAAVPKPVANVLFTENSSADYLQESAWDPSGSSIVYSISTATQYELRRLSLGGSDDLLFARTGEQIRYPDVSPDGTRILISNYALGTSLGVGYTSELSIQDGSLSPNFKGQYARYEPNGTRILFIDYQTYNARYLRYRDSNGLPGQIGGKAVYWSIDWRK